MKSSQIFLKELAKKITIRQKEDKLFITENCTQKQAKLIVSVFYELMRASLLKNNTFNLFNIGALNIKPTKQRNYFNVAKASKPENANQPKINFLSVSPKTKMVKFLVSRRLKKEVKNISQGLPA